MALMQQEPCGRMRRWQARAHACSQDADGHPQLEEQRLGATPLWGCALYMQLDVLHLDTRKHAEVRRQQHRTLPAL